MDTLRRLYHQALLCTANHPHLSATLLIGALQQLFQSLVVFCPDGQGTQPVHMGTIFKVAFCIPTVHVDFERL